MTQNYKLFQITQIKIDLITDAQTFNFFSLFKIKQMGFSNRIKTAICERLYAFNFEFHL